MIPSILLLTREPLINNRTVINNLWCRIIPSNNINIFWVSRTNIDFFPPIKKIGNLYIIANYIPLRNKSLFNEISGILYKFRVSNFFARKGLINQLQVRNGVTDGLICLILRLKYNLPYSFHLSSLHGFEDESLLHGRYGLQRTKFKLRIFFYPLLYKLIFSFASIIQPISEYMGDYLVKEAKVSKDKIFPLPVSSTHREISLDNEKSLSSKPIIVYAGSLDISRDIEFLIRIFGLIHNKRPATKFRILGIVEKATNIHMLEKQISAVGIKKLTKLYLNVPPRKVPNLILECDIGISPIKPNKKYIVSTPTKTIEYLSCGLPVVCNEEILDQKHIIKSSKGGLAVPYDENEFTKAIISIIDNKDMYLQMSKAGKKWISDNRTYNDLSVGLIQKYKEISNSVL